jgi:hypothetical protein
LGLSAPTLTCHWACTNCGMIKADSASVQRNIAEILKKLKAVICPPKGIFFAGYSSWKSQDAFSSALCCRFSRGCCQMETREHDQILWQAPSNGNAQNCGRPAICR